MLATLAGGVVLTLVTTTLFALVGAWTWRRPAHGEARLASRMFALWWLAVGGVVLLAGAHTLVGLLGVTDLRAYVALAYLVDVPLAIALWALLYYLVFLYTGRRAAIWPLSIAYLLFIPFAWSYTAAQGARVLVTTDWDIRAVGTATPPAWLNAAFGILLLAPVLVIVAAYGVLLARVHAPLQRYRLALTSAAFALWFTPVLAGFLLGWQSQPWFAWLYQTPGLLAAGLIVAAYRPPRFVQRRLDARSKGGPAP